MNLRASVVALSLVASSLVGAGALVDAHQTTPTAVAPPANLGIAGVKVEVLGRGPSIAAPGYSLQLIRLTFEPGGRIALHDHPGDAVFYVESGAIGWTTGQGTPLLTHSGAAPVQSGTPPPAEPLTPGAEVILEPGDAVFYNQEVTHAVRNADTDRAVVLYSALRKAHQPGIEFAASTPAP